jgi:hypothetical protein
VLGGFTSAAGNEISRITALDIVPRTVEQLDSVVGIQVLRPLNSSIEIDVGIGSHSEGNTLAFEPWDGIRVQPTTETMGVVGKSLARADVHNGALEGAILDTATAGLSCHVRPANSHILLLDEVAIAAETVIRVINLPVVDVDTTVCINGPIPVGLSAIVATFLPESLLVCPNE